MAPLVGIFYTLFEGSFDDDASFKQNQDLTNLARLLLNRSERSQKREMGVKATRLTAALLAGTILASASGRAATQVGSVSVNGNEPNIASLIAGETINMVATLNTQDPNENGEGEPLIIGITGGAGVGGGIAFQVPNYAQPTPLPAYTAQGPVTFDAVISGYDNDESATINYTVSGAANPPGPNIFPPNVKAVAAQVSGVSNIIAAGSALVAAIAAASGAEPVALGSAIASGATWLISAAANQVAIDPTDPNFRVVATPAPPHLDTSGFPAPIANLINTEEQILGLLNAIVTTANRATSAFNAGDTASLALQKSALASYEAQLAPLLANLRAAYAAYGVDITSLGFNNVSPSQVLSFEQNIASAGLSTDLLTALQELGADSNTIANIDNLLFVQDINAVSRDIMGGFADPTFSSDLGLFSDALISASGSSSSPGTSVPEPSSVASLLVGLAGLIAMRRYRAKNLKIRSSS